MITELDGVHPPTEGEPPAGLNADHPMRQVTRAVAFTPDGWTPELRAQVAHAFDQLAPEWHTRDGPDRQLPLFDALDRGLGAVPPSDRRVALEIGSGTGLFSSRLATVFPTTMAVDLALEMLRLAPDGPAPRVQGDAATLPVRDGAVDALVLINALLFPEEARRVLGPEGLVIWINSRGSDTPIHLRADEVDAALGEGWDGVASTAGWGTWSVHWRRR